MNKKYIITSGWGYVTRNGGTSSARKDAKRFSDYDNAITVLIDLGLDLFYWDVEEVEN